MASRKFWAPSVRVDPGKRVLMVTFDPFVSPESPLESPRSAVLVTLYARRFEGVYTAHSLDMNKMRP